MSRWLRLIAIAAMPLTLAGCPLFLLAGGAAVGAGAVMWATGTLSEDVNEPIYRVHRAAGAALLDLKAVIEKNELKEDAGLVDGTLSDGSHVAVKTSRLADMKTRVRIRVGMTGDERVSRQILAQMKKHL